MKAVEDIVVRALIMLLLWGLAPAKAGMFEQTDEERAHTNEREKTIFLVSDRVKVGFDLSSGGAIFHLSSVADGRNLLNHFDRGRFIQQSFYGDEDGSIWQWADEAKPWRWNPVQGGDYRGRPATVLEQKVEGGSLYIKSTPVHWASGEDIEDASMEQWVSLSGDVVTIKYRFKYSGNHEHEERHQEMPAVFVDHALANLVYYDGDIPWTEDALTSIVPGWPNERYTTSEHWSAYVDDRGHGVGVFTPGTSLNTRYRYKGDGTEGPLGSATSYFAPIRSLAIGPETDINYEVYLTIGTVKDIRARFRRFVDCGSSCPDSGG